MRYIIPTLLALFVLLMALAGSNIKRAEAEERATATEIRLAAAQDSATYWQGRSQQLEAELVEMIHAPLPDPTGELLTPSGLTVQELESGLHDDLKPYAGDFLQTERDTGVNAVFLAAVAALESGWGGSEVAQERNNLFGWTGADGYMWFYSKPDCIAYVAEMIRALYLSPEGPYFKGYTVEAVNVRYNGNPEWAEAVRQIMREIEERAAE